jgi:predicted permease
MREFLHDIRYSVRSLARTPGFAILAILTLALGIGANSAIFSVINGVILKPLGYPNPDQLVMVTSQFPGLGFDKFWISPPEYFELRERAKSFSEIGAYRASAVNLSENDSPERVNAVGATWTLFKSLGVAAYRGRVFNEQDDLPNAAPVALLSYQLWQRAFAGDPATVGRQIDIDGQKTTVLGIMPAGFDIHDSKAEVWLPMGLDPANRQNRGSHFLYLVGRLKPGVNIRQANAELNTLLAQWGQITPNTHVPHPVNHRLQYASLASDVVGNIARALWVLQVAVGFVLLIACANMANLLLARAESRHREFAIRTALGAGRGRLLRQFMAEGVTLAVLGGAVGLALAYAGLKTLIAANPDSLPRAADIGLDSTVVAFTIVVALLTGVVFGLAPLLHIGQRAVSLALKEGGTRSTATIARNRVRRGLVVAEVALAVMLVIGAGLMLRSFWKLMRFDSGFDRTNLSTFGLVLPAAKYQDQARRVAFFNELTSRLKAAPGVQSAAAMGGVAAVPPGERERHAVRELPARPGRPAGERRLLPADDGGLHDRDEDSRHRGPFVWPAGWRDDPAGSARERDAREDVLAKGERARAPRSYVLRQPDSVGDDRRCREGREAGWHRSEDGNGDLFPLRPDGLRLWRCAEEHERRRAVDVAGGVPGPGGARRGERDGPFAPDRQAAHDGRRIRRFDLAAAVPGAVVRRLCRIGARPGGRRHVRHSLLPRDGAPA